MFGCTTDQGLTIQLLPGQFMVDAVNLQQHYKVTIIIYVPAAEEAPLIRFQFLSDPSHPGIITYSRGTTEDDGRG